MSKPLSEMTLQELWQLFPIILVEHNEDWKLWYAQESDAVRHALGGEAVARMSHIGSTAVEGMTAKPTVDILLELVDVSDMAAVIEKLEGAGWRWQRTSTAGPSIDAAYLNKGYTERGFAERVFHLHIRAHGDWDELYFRDLLRVDAAAQEDYVRLKRSLMARYEHDRDAYTEGKTEFVKECVATARQRFGGRHKP